jgi:hypothetical protein
MTMKKIAIGLMALTMAISMVAMTGCGKDEESSSVDDSASSAATMTVPADEGVTPTETDESTSGADESTQVDSSPTEAAGE